MESVLDEDLLADFQVLNEFEEETLQAFSSAVFQLFLDRSVFPSFQPPTCHG